MQKVKKYLSLAVVTCLMLSLVLTGCGDSGTASNSTSAASSAAASTAAASSTEELPEVELSWYLPGPAQKDMDKVNEELNKITKEKINATVKVNLIDFSAWKDKSSVMIAAGENFDMMFTAGWSSYSQNVAKGAFVDITDLMGQYAPKTKEMLHAAYLEGSKINGKNYAVPTSKELAHSFGFLYRVDIAEKYGLDLTGVKSYGELEPFLKVIKEKEPDMYPMEGYYQNNPMQLLDFDAVGDNKTVGKLYPDKDTKVINEYETPEAMEILKIQHKYFKAGYMRSDAATVKDRNPDLKGMKDFLVIGTLKPLLDEDMGTTYGGKWKMVELTKRFIAGNDTTGSMQAISRTSKNVERSLMFLELVNTDATVNNILNYGIENVHYVKKSDNVIAFASGLDAKTSGYYPNIFWVIGNQFLNYIIEGNNTEKWSLYKEFNDSAASSKILGFTFDAEPIKTELAACANVREEFEYGIGTGSLDPEVYLPKYIEKLKQSGADKIIAEKQKQIDAWVASKK